MTASLTVQNLSWAPRGRDRVLHDTSFALGAGRVLGIVGPNGAGKSTLIKILMTVIRSSGGEGLVLGKPIGHKPTLAKIGYLPEHHAFPGYLTGGQLLEFYAALNRVPRDVRKRRVGELLELVGMAEWAKTKVLEGDAAAGWDRAGADERA